MRRPIRIAILDTGVNKKHPSINVGFELGRLSDDRCYNWVDNSTNVEDSDGHGTNVTTQILRAAPEDVEIYVAKVFSKKEVHIDELDNVVKVRFSGVCFWLVLE